MTHAQPVLGLVDEICKTLDAERVVYCHWKSNVALDRSATGQNDLDLLVDRESAQRFTEALWRCGLKEARMPSWREVPGVLNYYGYDPQSDRLVHVHVHHHLVLGHDLTKNYHLPIETPFLASSTPNGLFRTPAPEFEFVVFVVRMALKHTSWGAVLRAGTHLSEGERREFAYLSERIDETRVHEILAEHLSCLDATVFDDFAQSLGESSTGIHTESGRHLQRNLQACARRRPIADECLKLWRYLVLGVQRRFFRKVPRGRVARGGALVAIVGGDGAGKSTAVDAVRAWLKDYYAVRQVHIGKPRWSFTTVVVRGLLKIGALLGVYRSSLKEEGDPYLDVFPGYPALVRAVCVARDRFLTYAKARRFASNGGLALCDRFPLPRTLAMDGPRIPRMTHDMRANRILKVLLRLEAKYYRQILPPDLLIVLKVDPETAVQRKGDEDPTSVRRRTAQVFASDWKNTPAHVIDANQPLEKVQSDLKALIWANL
jgi:thymidylate kinase